MSRTAVAHELVRTQARALKMPAVAREFEALARQAGEERWTHEEYLHEVLGAEQQSRHESVIRQRLRDARFPEIKTLDGFDFQAAEGIQAAQIHALARGDWIGRAENLIFAGPIGTGKTHLAIALGVEATKQKRRVLFARAADLVRMLLEARDARELGRLQRRLLVLDVLIVDELVPRSDRECSWRHRFRCSCFAGPGVPAAVAGGIVSIASAIWTGQLPRPVARIRWLQWALEWEAEAAAEARD